MKKLLFTLLGLVYLQIVHAQQASTITPYSLTLPRVTTSQQTTGGLVPQQPGNVVFNTDQKSVAVHNGTDWTYLNQASGEFKNMISFYYPFFDPDTRTVWNVPQGVTKIFVELWGGGGGGDIYSFINTVSPPYLSCSGGAAGGYASGLVSVIPGQVLDIKIGHGGKGRKGNGITPTTYDEAEGGYSQISFPNNFFIIATGAGWRQTGSGYFSNGGAGLFGTGNFPYSAGGKQLSMSFEPRGSNDYVMNLKFGDGGVAHGAPPGGEGGKAAFLNGGSVLYQIQAQYGSFPGGGGGGGYQYGGDGANGFAIIRW